MIWRLVMACIAVLTLSFSAAAYERIDSFDIDVLVLTDGDFIVTETIKVTSEGRQIRRGIFRDLPRYFADDTREGDKLTYKYDVMSVRRDGQKETYSLEREGNAYRIRIGNADVFLPDGQHVYEIRYRTQNQVRYFPEADGVYWNVTGNYWAFPIETARARITLPEGTRVLEHEAYTGVLGGRGSNYTYRREGDTHIFEATEPLAIREGLTAWLAFEKGVIDPPSFGDKTGLWWMRNGALALLITSFLGVLSFLLTSFRKVGEDPPKPPVFARYEPPAGYSPGAAHYVYYRGSRGHSALISSLMHMAVQGLVEIDAKSKKKTILRRQDVAPSSDLPKEQRIIQDKLFGKAKRVSLGGKYSAKFTKAYTSFKADLGKRYGREYFRWNIGYTVVAIALTILGIIVALTQAINWSGWLTLMLLAFAAMNGLFMYLMPAPTPRGQKIRTEIEGFRLYLETAEKLALNAVKVGSDAPPPMTKERYEKFLPYAIALDVEKPWTKHFEKALPIEAANYSPAWGEFGNRGFKDVGGMNDAIYSSMSSGVSSSLPQSSSSSGSSSSGGFSGGGGGGGGGGGW